ncbi:uncharacterized protein LOC127583227 [Pristis pectinata]|uniref:uncharacterized protein LOC127583227 n=1 Tax=Pristis pectinata TaxID=685728 RepID=UPI00223DBD3B|nr:uncharacterized protein LOC127583227 [Pristis pectinata]
MLDGFVMMLQLSLMLLLMVKLFLMLADVSGEDLVIADASVDGCVSDEDVVIEDTSVVRWLSDDDSVVDDTIDDVEYVSVEDSIRSVEVAVVVTEVCAVKCVSDGNVVSVETCVDFGCAEVKGSRVVVSVEESVVDDSSVVGRDSDEDSVVDVICVDSEKIAAELSVTKGDVVAVTWVSEGDTVSEDICVVLGWVCVDCIVLDDSCVVGCVSEEDVVVVDTSDIGWVCDEDSVVTDVSVVGCACDEDSVIIDTSVVGWLSDDD